MEAGDVAGVGVSASSSPCPAPQLITLTPTPTSSSSVSESASSLGNNSNSNKAFNSAAVIEVSAPSGSAPSFPNAMGNEGAAPAEGVGSSRDQKPQLSNTMMIVTSLAAGGCAGALAKTTIAPLDRCKIYFQTHPEKNYRMSGAIKFLRLTYESEGFLRLWRGNTATMARIVPYASTQFMAFEQYKKLLGIERLPKGE